MTTSSAFRERPKRVTGRKVERPVPEQAHNFGRLPDEAFVNRRVVEYLFSCSKASVWRYVRSGAIPKPHKIGLQSYVWQVGELRASLASKIA